MIAEEQPQPAALDGPAVVEVRELTKRFGQKTALKGVNWRVPRGQICGLLGPNGAGKTTLFRLMMGILKATEGSLRVEGLDCFEDRVRVKRLVGFLPDEPVFYSYLTGREVLELSASMHGLDPGSAIRRLEPLIGRMRMSQAMKEELRQRFGATQSLEEIFLSITGGHSA
jgi:ABC-type multidrug transport system ATPase subunit